jgi:hypothetical protein
VLRDRQAVTCQVVFALVFLVAIPAGNLLSIVSRAKGLPFLEGSSISYAEFPDAHHRTATNIH